MIPSAAKARIVALKEAEAGGSEILGRPPTRSESKASLRYVISYLKNRDCYVFQRHGMAMEFQMQGI